MTCYTIELEDGSFQRVQGEPTDDPETLEAIRAVIQAAKNILVEDTRIRNNGVIPWCRACDALVESEGCYGSRPDCDHRLIGA